MATQIVEAADSVSRTHGQKVDHCRVEELLQTDLGAHGSMAELRELLTAELGRSAQIGGELCLKVSDVELFALL